MLNNTGTPPVVGPTSRTFLAIIGLWLADFAAGALGGWLLANMAGYAGDAQYGKRPALGYALFAAAIVWMGLCSIGTFVVALRLMRGKGGWLWMAAPPLVVVLGVMAIYATL